MKLVASASFYEFIIACFSFEGIRFMASSSTTPIGVTDRRRRSYTWRLRL